VGHVTLVREEPDPPEGRGIARTGVSVVVPGPVERVYAEPLQAGVAVLNGAGELTGSHEIREWGWLASPVYLCATMAVGRVYDGAVSAAMEADPAIGIDEVTIPVVGECDDSWLSDARDVQVEAADVSRAIEDARPEFAQGAVGAGTGMVCFDWKGGIGSASRVTPGGHVVGVLVLTNFGAAEELRIDGVPIGRLLARAGRAPAQSEPGPGQPAGAGPSRPGPPAPAGSCIAVVATDAPLGSGQLTRLARRAGLGLGRAGSVGHDGSGEIFVAFSTGRGDELPGGELDPFFAAVVDATEESVLNSLWAAEDVQGREGRVVRALPHEPVLRLLREAGRI
jgi:D-aminopeptidase